MVFDQATECLSQITEGRTFIDRFLLMSKLDNSAST